MFPKFKRVIPEKKKVNIVCVHHWPECRQDMSHGLNQCSQGLLRNCLPLLLKELVQLLDGKG